MIGLPKSGKRTLLNQISCKFKHTPIYSGDLITALKYSKFNLLCYHNIDDNSIQNHVNPVFQKIEALIFVVDSSNLADLNNSHVLLQSQLNQLKGIPILLIISKYHKAQITIQEIVIQFELIKLRQPWFVRTVGSDVSEIEEGLDWLYDQIKHIKQ
ncbi:unnamed protein product (macronuclear) [Paramecium tetraurelia]|uniref:ADP-ribosylation factor n=1 Tax=Paramecium tetraurelia TaxID=5888 RepID=A0E508_PARTE|nr:uncharacterized protein GSPATT00023552001 [Paramecium tetraurelia]CAK90375.1 unnamed protein product [Paramecium tetraurelia]|eukprot:XP_001457772.1 hypothetical protein (macronuclear) [Paramecium tetraurelia strain d4-2]